VGLEHHEESVLNDDPVGDIDVNDNDDSEPIVRLKRTKSTMKLAEPAGPRRIKTTTSLTVPLNVLLPCPRTHSLGPPIIFPLPDDTIDSRSKKKQSTPKSAITTPKTA